MRFIYIFFFLICCCLTVSSEDKLLLRVGLPNDPPLTYRNEQGEPEGFNVELLDCFASENSWDIIYVDGTWEECLERLKGGEIDLLCSVVKTPERQASISFSEEPVYIEWGKIFVRYNQPYKSVLELNNQIVGLVRGDVHAENFKSFIKQFQVDCIYKYYDSYQDAVDALQNKQVFAIVCNSAEGPKFQYSRKVRNTGIVFGGAPSRYGVPKGKFGSVLKRLDEQLKSARANRDSVYYSLLKKYLDTEKKLKVPQWLWYALSGASCAAVVFLIISIILRLQVNRQMKRLWEREEYLRTTLDSIGDAVIVTDQTGNVVRINPVAETFTGWRRDDAAGIDVRKVFNIENVKSGEPVEGLVQKVMESGNARELAGCVTLTAKNGKRRQVAAGAAPIRRGSGVTQGVVLVFRDVTEEFAAHEKLEESESRLRAVLDHLPIMVVAYDEDGKLAYWNSECERVIGWTADELLGTSHEEIFKRVYPAIDYSKHRFEDAIKNRVLLSKGEWHMLTKDGSVKAALWYDVIGKAKIPGWAFWSAGVDITERLELEQQVRQMQKLESIGNLAAGVAHDFNNILQVIRGYTDMIIDAVEKDSDTEKAAQTVLSSVDRGGNLVRQLLFFSSQSGFAPEVVNPAELILDLFALLKRMLGEDVKLDLDVAGSIPDTYADPNQIEQALINICLNSRQAMPVGGSIKISSREVTISRSEQTIVGELPAGKYVTIEIADTGCGIEPEIQPRIFEPFFTTRNAGQGSGLGLATVYGVMKRHEGGITVNSKPGHGSIFTLWLPVTNKPQKSEEITPAEIAENNIRQEFSKVILLAEDEESVRDLSVKILANAGYTVIPVTNGRAAVSAFKEQPDGIDLLIFDIIMSEMNGPEAFREICHIKPGLPVIFASGYGDSRLEQEELPEKSANVLRKPFSRKELLATVDKVLLD